MAKPKIDYIPLAKELKKHIEIMESTFAANNLQVINIGCKPASNIGGDLEVLLINGKKRYYEVKSVESLGEMISITNNEYSTGMHYRKDYYLAIAHQTDDTISICFVPDPINNLMLTKRVTRWEWICNEYQGEVITTKMS